MKLTFLGAAGEVTGSATLLECAGATLLIDFGLHQGPSEIERRNRNQMLRRLVRRDELTAVVLTHAHLDHCGRLPLLESWGLSAPIRCTPATAELAPIVMRDSAAIQVADYERHERHRGDSRGGRGPGPEAFPPLYGPLEANAAIERLVPTPFEQETELAPGVSLRFVANAHILGSACALITAREHGVERRVLFSGDVGHPGVRIARVPDPPPPCDALVLESTYGDRDHRSPEATFDEFAALLEQAVQRRGVVLVPAFAIGRAQTLLWMISEVVRTRRLPRFPVYLDSPMAVDVTRIHQRWREELLNEEGRRRLAADGRLLVLDDFHQVREADASRRLNDLEGPAVIVAPSGMCTGGRILHHLRHHIGSPSTTVLIVGFQGEGTIGRELVEGARTIEIFGESLPVRAQVRTLNGLSAHAGRSELLAWVEPLASNPPMLFLNHGEDRPRASLATAMKERLGQAPFLPQHGQEFVV